ncbi:glycosyl hydrolase 53 family protein, partial [bacterium]|nr:glycosyl hydrolase 53 family protein [bacterium]
VRPSCPMIAIPLLVAFALAVSTAAVATPVTLVVDMRIEKLFERFEPGVDTVVVRGAFNGWAGNADALTDLDGDGIYTIVLDLTSGTYDFKFVIPEATHDRWEHSIDNRSVTVAGSPVEVGHAFFDHRTGWVPGTTRVGSDVSFTHRLLAAGAEYRSDGQPLDLFAALADHGQEIVRLRLWHTPAEPWHGLPATILMAQEAKAAGHDLMLDLHYSDSWADPGQQTKPGAWVGIPFAALGDSVYAYTNSVVLAFRDAGVLPEYIQIGNEVSPGMLWDDGRVGWQGSAWDTPAQWDKFAALLSAGIAGARDSLSVEEQPAIIIHRAEGGDNAGCQWFYDNLLSRGVSFDIIGLSFYPWWHGTIWDLRDNLADLAPRYGKELMVVETAYPWTLDWHDATNNFVWEESQLHENYPATPDGQFEFLRDLVAIVEGVPGGLGTGVVYWEPGYIAVDGGPGSPYENLTLFDFDGDALRGLGYASPWATVVESGDENAGEEQGNRVMLSPAAPNPFRGSSTLTLTIFVPGAHARVRVFDVTGRVVATLVDRNLTPGRHELTWDGRSDSGAKVASGIYLIGATVSGERATARLVHLK